MKPYLYILLMTCCLIGCNNGYEVHLIADRVDGLEVKAPVQINGFQIGEVTHMKLLPDARVFITAEIDEEIDIPTDSQFHINSLDILGTKAVAITPGSSGDFFRETDTITSFEVLPTALEKEIATVVESFTNLADSLQTRAYDTVTTDSNTPLPSGVYRFDMAFAEWQGKSMGEQVTVTIDGDSIMVVYEGDGAIENAPGHVFDRGIIMKHQSGAWIIANDSTDVFQEEVGGCTGGATVIDFANKKYWTC